MPLPAYYSSTPSLNVSINGINIGEGMARSDMNNALRQMMADIKDWTDAYAITSPVPIADGGTGEITAAAALAALGGLDVAYKHLPQDLRSTGFTLAVANDGGHVCYTGAATSISVPTNASVPFEIGSVVVIVNRGSAPITIARAGGVSMIWDVSGADADRTLATNGRISLLKIATDGWMIGGAGLS